MKGKKGAKSATTSEGSSHASGKVDTSRWESLLAGAKSNGVAAVSHRTAVPGVVTEQPPPSVDAQPSNGLCDTVAAKSRTRNKGKDRCGVPVAANNGARSNWEKLLNQPTSQATTVNAAGLHNGTTNAAIVADAGKSSKTKKKKRRRPENPVVQAFVEGTLQHPATAEAVAVTRSQGAGGRHTSTTNCGVGDQPKVGLSGERRKRSRTKRVGGPANDESSATHATVGELNGVKHEHNGGGETHGFHRDHRRATKGRREEAEEEGFDSKSKHYRKWPKPNSLNAAFQAQQAAADLEKKEVTGKGKGGTSGIGKEARGKGREQMSAAEKALYVGLDCEMVGVGPGGCRSALARCCMVDWDGNVIYDKHVVPNERVTDFRTFVSGVKPKDLRGGLSLRKCQDEVAAILDGKVLVGHALKNDLAALLLSHPPRRTRDTATYRPYQKAHGKTGGKLRPKSLKGLALEHLDRTIQEGQHHPAEDARAAMDLYKVARQEWEKSLAVAGKTRRRRAVVDQQDG